MEKVLTSLLDKCEFNHDIIYDLVVDLVDYYDLNEYVESFSFKRLKTNGQFDKKEREISIDLDNILFSSSNDLSFSSKYDLDITKTYMINIVLTILYELTRVNQSIIANENKYDSYHTVVRDSIELSGRAPDNLTPSEELLYRYEYSRLLTERDASIESMYELLQLNRFRILNDNEIKYLEDKLLEQIRSGYGFGKTPAKTYYELRDRKQDYSILDFNDEVYDTYTRLCWGLPVSRKIIKSKELLKML